jgi:hypothetical protein
MPCGVELIQHHGHQGDAGVRQWYNHLNDSKFVTESTTKFGYNQATSYTGNAGESCMAVGYSWHQGGKINNSGNPKGDILTFRNGYHDLQTKWGQQTRTWNDDIDGVRLQSVPSATSSQMQFHINVPEQPQSNMNYFSPRDIKGGTVHDDNGTSFDPCPGASAKYLNSKSGVRCIYPKTASALQTLHGTAKVSNMAAMHTSLADTFCSDSNNVFYSPGGQSCLERTEGKRLAKTYCEVGSKINGSDLNCTKENLGTDNYESLAEVYCAANPNDSFCSCYNVVMDKCGDDSITGVAGCDHASGKAYVNNRNATPSDQKSLWDGQRKCGSVCTGADKYIPDNNQAGCKTTIQICSQTFNVDNMSNSDINASCELNASDGSSVGVPPSAAQDSAKSELEEAKAALARGDAGAQERVDAAEAALDAADESAGETGPKAYIPKSLDGLKNDRKQQIGAGVMGALVLGCMMMLLLLVVSTSGGGGGPAKRRFR